MSNVYGCNHRNLSVLTTLTARHVWIVDSEGRLFSSAGEEIQGNGEVCPYCGLPGVHLNTLSDEQHQQIIQSFQQRQRVLSFLESRREQVRVQETNRNRCTYEVPVCSSH